MSHYTRGAFNKKAGCKMGPVILAFLIALLGMIFFWAKDCREYKADLENDVIESIKHTDRIYGERIAR